ncbi:4-hydroxythreonine-4-phosphate dehydrogenase PdxA [bacterium]|nr:4-hydroxythreonine-4-phosphate dehydrogenase PdxA [bacterium]
MPHAHLLPKTPRDRPLIALTMGDAAGIGPELVVRAAADSTLQKSCRLVAVGHTEVLQRAAEMLELRVKLADVSDFAAASKLVGEMQSTAGDDHASVRIPVVNPCRHDVAAAPVGKIDGRCGQAAYDCLVAAAQAALTGLIDGVTTAPLNKAALHAAGRKYPGHTEILGEVCGVDEFGMMLYLPLGDVVRSPHGLGVVHTTLHTSIRSVPDLLTTDVIASHIRLMDEFMRQVGAGSPRVAVCALNPHAGEDGLFGDEEARIIRPAVEMCRAAGINVAGPLPADTLLRRAVAGEFDGVVAMYHDQGHIALKLIGFDRAVNITLGLPIIRTSPSHGTAFDIAWQGKASGEGMVEAIRMAAVLANARQERRQ